VIENRNGRNLSAVVLELVDELKALVRTRAQLLASEMQEKAGAWGTGTAMFVIAGAFLGTAYLLLTAALVALVAMAFPDNPYRWFLAFLIVGVLWSICGAICFFMGKSAFKSQGVLPENTIRVLKEDQLWLEKEARSQA
jgi:MFS family permease